MKLLFPLSNSSLVPVGVQPIKEVLHSVSDPITLTHVVHLEHSLSHQGDSIKVSSTDQVKSVSEQIQIIWAASLHFKLEQVSKAIVIFIFRPL